MPRSQARIEADTNLSSRKGFAEMAQLIQRASVEAYSRLYQTRKVWRQFLRCEQNLCGVYSRRDGSMGFERAAGIEL